MIGVTVGKVVLGMINDKNNVLGVAATVLSGIAGLALLFIGRASWLSRLSVFCSAGRMRA